MEGSPAPVIRHYGELDRFYRELWGEHVHHGLWLSGRESPEEAVEALVRRAADRAGIGAGDRVCDIGSGYGAPARLLVRERDARVTAITVSPAQHERAVGLDPGENPRYVLADWLENGLSGASFDAAVAIESTEHMGDPEGAFREVRRVLRPGARLVVCAWLAAEAPSRWARRHLLEPIRREGRLAWLPTAVELRGAVEAGGLRVEGIEDLTREVRRTWSVCLRRALGAVLRRPDYRAFLLDRRSEERVFAVTMVRIWLAYRLGAMRYGLLTARRPREREGGRRSGR